MLHRQASFTMAPAGWYISERIGWPLWKIHGPVPIWDVKLRTPVEKYAPSILQKLMLTLQVLHWFEGLQSCAAKQLLHPNE